MAAAAEESGCATTAANKSGYPSWPMVAKESQCGATATKGELMCCQGEWLPPFLANGSQGEEWPPFPTNSSLGEWLPFMAKVAEGSGCIANATKESGSRATATKESCFPALPCNSTKK